MNNGNFNVRNPQNEEILNYLPENQNWSELKSAIQKMKSEVIEIPLIIDGKEVKTGNMGTCIIPHNHKHILAQYHIAGEKEISMAIDAAQRAKKQWQRMPWEHRASIFLKAAELLAGPWRYTLNAATMLCQSKTAYQAEIDSACELIDFLRFNVYYMQEIYKDQPLSTNTEWNRLEYRPLEGFVLAITPFNFTAIGGNLATAPAMLGNTVVWKPALTAVYSNYFVMKLLQEAGLPDGVINFISCRGADVEKHVMNNRHMAGVHFTGSTEVFNKIWKQTAQNLEVYQEYPHLVGETGGKDFIFAHSSADKDALVTALIRGAFEYQGQKCSAASRAYIPKTLWNEMKCTLKEELKTVKVGDVEDPETFMGAVIDQKAFDRIKSYIEYAKKAKDAVIYCGGSCDDAHGYFIEPTVIVTTNPHFKTMEEEIFGPVLTIYVYDEDDLEDTLELCDTTSQYGLTGSIFAKDRNVIANIEQRLCYAAGNIYINDKPTGAVVGQQPFGGGRNSGTNDKAGSKLNLLRWCSPRTIKENFNPPKNYRYTLTK